MILIIFNKITLVAVMRTVYREQQWKQGDQIGQDDAGLDQAVARKG